MKSENCKSDLKIGESKPWRVKALWLVGLSACANESSMFGSKSMFIILKNAPKINRCLRGSLTIVGKHINFKPRTITIQSGEPLSKTALLPEKKFLVDQIRSMATEKKVKITPPPSVLGMKILDRSAFTVTAQIPSLYVPKKGLGKTLKLLKESFFRRLPFKSVVELNNDNDDDPRASSVLIHFDPARFTTVEDLPSDGLQQLREVGVTASTFENIDITVTYDNWRYDEVLAAVLPPEIGRVAGFSIIGHIVHLNLRENQLEYKSIIGNVLYVMDSSITPTTTHDPQPMTHNHLKTEFQHIFFFKIGSYGNLVACSLMLKQIVRE